MAKHRCFSLPAARGRLRSGSTNLSSHSPVWGRGSAFLRLSGSWGVLAASSELAVLQHLDPITKHSAGRDRSLGARAGAHSAAARTPSRLPRAGLPDTKGLLLPARLGPHQPGAACRAAAASGHTTRGGFPSAVLGRDPAPELIPTQARSPAVPQLPAPQPWGTQRAGAGAQVAPRDTVHPKSRGPHGSRGVAVAAPSSTPSSGQAACGHSAAGTRRQPPGSAPRDAALHSSPSSRAAAKLAASNCHQLQGSRGRRAREGAKFPRNHCHLAPRSCESGPEQERKSASPCCQHENVIYDGWCPDEDALLAPQPSPAAPAHPAFVISTFLQPAPPLPFAPLSSVAPSLPLPCRYAANPQLRTAKLSSAEARGSDLLPRPTDPYLMQSVFLPVIKQRFIRTASARPLASKNDISHLLVPIAIPAPVPAPPAGRCEGQRGAPTPQPPAGEPRARELRCYSNGRAPGDEGWGQRQGEPPGRTG